MKFQTLDVPNCKENYLDIYDGSSNNTNGSTLLARFCGKNATAGTTVASIKNALYIVLKSGNNSESLKSLGFHAEYKDFQLGIIKLCYQFFRISNY